MGHKKTVYLNFYRTPLEIILFAILLLYLLFTLHFFLSSVPLHFTKISFTVQGFEQVLIAKFK